MTGCGVNIKKNSRSLTIPARESDESNAFLSIQSRTAACTFIGLTNLSLSRLLFLPRRYQDEENEGFSVLNHPKNRISGRTAGQD